MPTLGCAPVSATVSPPPALRALLDAGAALVRRSSSGRVALGRAADVVPADALPAALADLPVELGRARDEAARPLAMRDVTRILKQAWGESPGRVLDELDGEPVAVTPVGQVHRGRTKDGRAVAVKVRRPGLEAAARSDLALLDTLTAPLRQVFGRLDAGAALGALREATLDELDLEHQAATLRRVRGALRDVDGLVLPAPVLDHCRPDVMVSDWLEGPTLREAAPNEPDAAARALVDAHLAAARAGLLLVDPRPGHVVLLPDGRVGLLGAGAARPADPERVAAVLAALEALRAGDADALAARIAGELELLPEADAARAAELALAVLGPLLGGPARLDGAALTAAGEAAQGRLDLLMELAAVLTPVPADLAAARMLWQLGVVLSRLQVTADWGALCLRAPTA